MIAIITAMESEAQGIIQRYHLDEIAPGIFTNRKVILTISGIGKIQATLALTRLLERFEDISTIINIGVVGALDPSLSRGDVVTASYVHEHDGYLPDSIRDSLTYQPLSIHKAPLDDIREVVVMTGDQFVEDSGKKDHLLSLGGHVVDMECYAYAKVAHVYKKPFTTLKVVIDERNEGSQEYVAYLSDITQYLPDALDVLISKLSNEADRIF